MKPENVKKVWECFRGYYNHYSRQIFHLHLIKEAIQRNIDGDFSPARFYRQIDSDVHLKVQQYIIYLQEQEATELQKQTSAHSVIMSKKRLTLPLSKGQSHEVGRALEYVHSVKLFQSERNKLFNPSVASDSPP